VQHEPDVTSAENLSLPDSRVSPEAEMIGQDEISRVRQLIDRLPPNQRQVLRLHSIEGCSQQEIEQLTGLSAANIRVLLSRARKMLREQYQKISNL
jgi:RNA polymerase sigma-70 factor (ECF subfamily)